MIKIIGVLFVVYALSSEASSNQSNTLIVKASLSWNVAKQVDEIVLSKGFTDGVPNLGKTVPKDAVLMTSFCYVGPTENVCSQIRVEVRKQNRKYRNGDHMGLGSLTCTSDSSESVVVAQYEILDDYAGNYNVERKINNCDN